MIKHPAPILVSEKSAARLMDMKPAEFRLLVDAGAFPPPQKYGELPRWRYADLEAVASGETMEEAFET